MRRTPDSMDTLKDLAQTTARSGHGSRLCKALLVVAIPATAALATACYGAPMAEGPYDSVGQYESSETDQGEPSGEETPEEREEVDGNNTLQ